MSGRWILDAMALFGASKRVIARHVSLRTSQFDDYKKTSSLAKAIASQTSRVTLTTKAATVLAGRLNEHKSRYSTVPEQSSSTINAPLPSCDSVRGHPGSEHNHEGLRQDHFYTRSEDNSTNQPVPSKTLEVQQEDAKEMPLPDGTIAQVEDTDGRLESGKDVFSVLSQIATPKQPLNTDEQGQILKLEVRGRSSTPDSSQEMTQPRTGKAQELQRQTEEQIPAQSAEPPPNKASPQPGALREEPEFATDQEKDVYYSRASGSSPALSSLPRVKLPKVTEATQASCDHVPDSGINQDVYYSSKSEDDNKNDLGVRAGMQKEPVSDEMYSEIFHSPRVAKLLGGRRKGNLGTDSLNLDGPQRLDSEQTKTVKEVNSDTFTTSDLIDGEIGGKSIPEISRAPNSAIPEKDKDFHQPAAVRKNAPSAELSLLID